MKVNSFNRKVDWFYNKLIQNNILPESEELSLAIKKLKQNYKPLFKSNSKVEVGEYNLRFSFETSDYKYSKEKNAEILVFRLTKQFNKIQTIFRVHIKL